MVAKGFNMYGDPVTIEGTELLARCIQHETDHLDGILFIDRMDPDQRKAAMKAIREAEWWGDPVPRVRVSPHKTMARPSDMRPWASDAPGIRRHAGDGGTGA